MIKRVDIGDYHLRWNDVTGFMARWGKTMDDDPVMCPCGPEICDVEISTVCHGIGKTMESRRTCSHCYKSLTPCGQNMDAATFSVLLKKLMKGNPALGQIAFGIGDIDSNPDMLTIMDDCRYHGIIPNVTTNGMGIDYSWAEDLARRCGAVAVSHYGMDDVCFNAVANLTAAGLKQVNLHCLLAKETYQRCFKLLDAVSTDPRLNRLKAVVFLTVKPKGIRNTFSSVKTYEEYKTLMDYATERGVQLGFDSCSAPMVLRALPSAVDSIDPCESGLFSLYVNVLGKAFPCSFSEGVGDWKDGIDLLSITDFTRDVWESDKLQSWREGLIKSSSKCKTTCGMRSSCRSCPLYAITVCKS